MADGWSLEEIKVVRQDVKLIVLDDRPQTDHPNRFRLVLGGTGYELVAGAAGSGENGGVRYYVKNAPGIYVEQLELLQGDPSVQRLYWIVITADGAHYRLGYADDAEEWQSVPHESHLHLLENPNARKSGIAWHVDTVTDPFGNQMAYSYFTKETDETIDWWNVDHWTSFDLTTGQNRLGTIAYNYPGRVTDTDLPPAPTVGSPTGTPASRIDFRAATDDVGNETFVDPLTNIYVYHGGGQDPIAEYRIVGELLETESEGGQSGCYDDDQGHPRLSHTRVISSITRHSATDDDPNTADAGYSLPSTTFTYAPLPHFRRNGNGCFRFHYLTGVSNGYGGEVAFDYLSDERSFGEYVRLGSLLYKYPSIGYSYVVSRMERDDGRHNSANATEYSYERPCYDQWQDASWALDGDFPDPTICASNGADDLGPLVGFVTTTQTIKDYSGGVINTQVARFSQSANTLGKPEQTELYEGSTLLERTAMTYVSIPFGATTFNPLESKERTVYEGGVSLVTRKRFGYASDMEGNGVYGNTTAIFDYGDVSSGGDERTTVRCFYPNTNNNYWMVNRIGLERMYEGIVTADASACGGTPGGSAVSETRYIYDQNGSYTDSPTKGALSKVRKGLKGSNLDGGTDGLITTQEMGYDQYGNVTSTTAPSGAAETVEYDAGHHLYPIRTTMSGPDISTRETTYAFYGFNAHLSLK